MQKRYPLIVLFVVSMLSSYAQNIPSYIPKDGLVGWWPFNGNANDESGNGNNGEVIDVILTSDRNNIPNSAYKFRENENSKGYIAIYKSIRDIDLFGNIFSISLWVKYDSASYWGLSILSKGSNNLHFGFDDQGSSGKLNTRKNIGIGFDYYDSKNTGGFGIYPDIVPKNGWNHIVCVKTKSGYNYYVNKQKYFLQFNQFNQLQSDIKHPLIIGYGSGGGSSGGYFRGSLDNLIIYNRELTDIEVERIFLEKEKPACNNLTANLTALSSPSFCKGDSLLLKTSTLPNLKYKWYQNGITIPNQNDSILVVQQSGNYQVSVSNDSTCATLSAIVPVIVYPSINESKTILNDTTLCEGETVMLRTNFRTGFTYQWKKDNVKIPNAKDSVYTVSSPGKYSVVTYSYCQDSVESKSVDIKYIQLPSLSNVIANGKTNFCFGDSVQLKLDKTYPYAYQWLQGTKLIANATDSIFYAKNSGDYSVRLANGRCFKLTSSTIKVQVELENPKINFTKVLFCEGDTTFSWVGNGESSWGYPGVTNYLWYRDNQEISGSLSANPYYTNNLGIDKAGIYKVKLTSSNCTVYTNSVELKYISPPKINSLSNNDTIVGCIPLNIMFNKSNYNDSLNTNLWQIQNWDFGDGSSSNDISPSHYFITSKNKDTTYITKLKYQFFLKQNQYGNSSGLNTCYSTVKVKVNPTPYNLSILGDSILYSGEKLKLSSNQNGVWTNLSPDTLKIDTLGCVTSLIDVKKPQFTSGIMLTIKNIYGCSNSIIRHIIIKPKVDLCSGFFGNLISENDLAGDTICTGSIKSYVYNGKKPYRYSWSTGDTIDKLFNLCPNFYTLTVTDSNKCSFEKRVDIISSNIKILQGSDIKDIDGNKYQTVKIGNQEWMSENLRVTKFNDGSIIQNITDELDWKHTAGGWCYYNNDSIHNNEMGKLYSQMSVWGGEKNVCPTGWHIPLEKDWDTLIQILGQKELAGTILRNSIFNVVYGGYRKDDGSFANIGKIGYWMSLTGTGASSAHAKSISDSSAIFNSQAHKYYGVSIRCVKDIISNDSLDLCSGFFGNLISENDLSGDTICTGKITSNVGGGLQPYSYQWSNGANTPIISGLCAQSYTLEVTDKNNCKLILTKSIDMDTIKNACTNFKGYINSVEATGIISSSCNGSVSTYVEGGKLPYSYVWSNGVTTSSITEVCQGEYTVTVTDAAKCALTLSAKVKVDSTKYACSGFYAKVTSLQDDANINGQCSGSIHTKVFGGKLPYSIKWNNGSTDSVLMNLCAGTYTMNVSDANNCTFWVITDIKSTQVVDPCKDFYAVITDLKDDQANSGSCTGSMIATAKGGKLPYSYQWNIGDTTSSLQNQCAGEYQVTIHDGNQCSVVVSTSIVKIGQQQTNLSLEIITKDASSIQACDGSMYVKILNGTAPYTYSHSNAATTFDRTGICSGVYTVTVKDAKGLENTATYVISNPINTITTIVKALKDSISLDTLKTQVKNNCSINYNAIDSVSIKEAEFVSLDTVLVTWAVYANNTTTYVSQKYGLSKGSGVYALALTMYCKELKDIGNYFTATQQYYFKEKSATTSIEEVNDQVQLKVYPNPFTDKIHVKLDRVGDYKLMLFDVTGKILIEKPYLNTNHMVVDLEQLETGEYLLKVMNEEFVQTRMITK